MSVVPRKRRPDQNTGRRAKVALHVEEQPCEARGEGAMHLLRADAQGNVRCVGCREPWWRLDELLNGTRGGAA